MAGSADGSKSPRKRTAKKATTTRRRSPASKEVTPDSSATPPTEPPPAGAADNPLGLEPDDFTPPDKPTPADDDVDLLDYEPAAPELVEWTPDRAGFLVRGGGLLLHTADGLSREPEGDQLWKATEADIDAIAPPLARILNRYEPARRLAGLSDEGELLLGMGLYLRRNLVERGQVATAKRLREEGQEGTTETWPQPDQPPPAT